MPEPLSAAELQKRAAENGTEPSFEEAIAGDPALSRVLWDVGREVAAARAKHPPMHSPHEGHSVIREELDTELWEHVCADTGRSPEARKEAIQVAAMAVRYILDLIDAERTDA